MSLLPTPPNETLSLGTTLFPQGSTLQTTYYDFESDSKRFFERKFGEEPQTCPSRNLVEYNICTTDFYSYNINFCNYAKKSKPLTGSPSVHNLFGHLVVVSIIYVIMALIWLQLLPAGNGKRKRPLSIFQSKKEKINEINNRSTKLQSVLIKNVSKNYGSCKAVENMSLKLKRGQITALLGEYHISQYHLSFMVG